jgi:tetratricopeptide (TPR) repeat protein
LNTLLHPVQILQVASFATEAEVESPEEQVKRFIEEIQFRMETGDALGLQEFLDEFGEEFRECGSHMFGQELLVKYARTLDRLANDVIKGKLGNESDAMAAALQAVYGWARVSESVHEAPFKAEKIFEALQSNYGDNQSLWKMLIQDNQEDRSKVARRWQNIYFAMLLAWSRSKQPEAPERAFFLLQRMKEEHARKTDQEPFVSAECYSCVMDILCQHLPRDEVVSAVQSLWDEMTAMSIQPNEKCYDVLIHAYQREGGRPEDAYEVFNNLLMAYSNEPDSSKSSFRCPYPLSLNRILTMYWRYPDKGRQALNQALEFEEHHPECRGFVNAHQFLTLMQKYVDRGLVEKAESLLDLMLKLHGKGWEHLKPTKRVFGAVMYGYARRKSTASLAKVTCQG